MSGAPTIFPHPHCPFWPHCHNPPSRPSREPPTQALPHPYLFPLSPHSDPPSFESGLGPSIGTPSPGEATGMTSRACQPPASAPLAPHRTHDTRPSSLPASVLLPLGVQVLALRQESSTPRETLTHALSSFRSFQRHLFQGALADHSVQNNNSHPPKHPCSQTRLRLSSIACSPAGLLPIGPFMHCLSKER